MQPESATRALTLRATRGEGAHRAHNGLNASVEVETQKGHVSITETRLTAHATVGGPKGIFRRLSAQIGIIQVKVDGLERSSQHRNMHRLSTCDRDRRVTDTVPQT